MFKRIHLRNYLILILFFLTFFLLAQNKRKTSAPEKKWAFFHPFAALKVNKIYKRCMPFYEEVKKENSLDAFESGGKLDAFRHVFFMAAFGQKVKINKIRKLGKAHEQGNYIHFLKNINEHGELPDSLSSVMDLYNNETGFKLGSENKNLELKNLKQLIIDELKKGSALYFKRNSKGNYLNCSDEVLPTEKYQKKWFIPKCLISTKQ